MGVIKRLMLNGSRSIRFYKYFFSYMLIVVLMLAVIGSIVYSQFLRTLKEEVEKANITALTQVRDTMDGRFREMQRITLQIAGNPQLTPYVVKNSGYTMYQSMTELNKYRYGNIFLHNIGIIYHWDDVPFFYTAEGVYRMDDFFQTIFSYENWSKEEFFQSISGTTRPWIRPAENVRINNSPKTQRYATYMYPLPMSNSNPYGTVIFFLNEDTLSEYVKPLLQKYDGAFFLANEEHEPILSISEGIEQANIKNLWASYQAVSLLEPVDSFTTQNATYSVVKLPSQDLFKFSVINVAEELIGEVGRSYGIDLAEGSGVAIVVNMPELDDEKAMIRDLVANIQKFFQEYYKFSLSVGVGGIYSKLDDISSSFLEAKQALEYRFTKGIGQILFLNELLEAYAQGARIGYPHELEDELAKAIRQGKPVEVEQTIHTTFNLIKQMPVTPLTAQSFCTGIVHKLVRMVDEMEDSAEPRWGRALEEILNSIRNVALLHYEVC